ncbi:MAG: Asp-tRNA(Asn)/Glu-tRNA(Gln) amidotransferase subunit GatC [Polyangiales bacterium]
MALDVTPERVRATADLARLDLRDDEVAPLAAQLQRIVDHVASLAALDLADVPPTSHVVALACPLRDDEPAPSLPREEALAAAPRAEGGGFVVPQFVAG